MTCYSQPKMWLAIGGLLCVFTAIPQSAQAPCPPNVPSDHAVKPGVKVVVVYNSNATPYADTTKNDAVNNAIYDGLATVNYENEASNGNASNNTFVNYDTRPAGIKATVNTPVVNVTVDMTTTPPPCGKELTPVGCATPSFYPNNPGQAISYNVVVYPNQSCPWGPCFDPSNTATFQTAIQSVFSHETQHVLGAGDATVNNTNNGQTNMGKFAGVNNTGKDSNGNQLYSAADPTVPLQPMASGPTPCDNTNIKKGHDCPCRTKKGK